MSNTTSLFQQFNTEINDFYKHLKENKYTEQEIRKILQPLQKKAISKNVKIFAYLLLALLIFYILSYLEFVSWNIAAVSRIFLIELLPFWDWTVLKNEKCLISKYSTPAVIENSFNCDLCENINHIDVYENIDEETLKIRYADIDTPVIVNQPLKSWIQSNNFIELLAEDTIIEYSKPCSLSTNIINGIPIVKTLLERATFFESFYMHFQNCDFQAMKQFRSYTPKPDFLPPEWSPVQYNWLLWSTNYNTTSYKPINFTQRIMVFCQIAGEFYINLKPKNNCKEQCNNIDIKLKQGELLIFTDLWSLEYRSESPGESIAVILELR